jgi:hypothetical protein
MKPVQDDLPVLQKSDENKNDMILNVYSFIATCLPCPLSTRHRSRAYAVRVLSSMSGTSSMACKIGYPLYSVLHQLFVSCHGVRTLFQWRHAHRNDLVEDAPGSMMGNDLLALVFHVLHSIVEEEINQNRVDFGIWVLRCNLFSDLLHTPDTASSQFNLP